MIEWYPREIQVSGASSLPEILDELEALREDDDDEDDKEDDDDEGD